MKTVLVLGYFGYENNQLDGQTVKTRNIYSLLKSKEGKCFEKVNFFDTQSFKNSKLNLFKLVASISKVEVIYYLPAHNNLKYIFPFLFIICKMLRIKLHYLVVGGWLYERLKNLPIHRWMLARIDHIYPETDELRNKLMEKYNYTNVTKLHNFRIVNLNTTNVVKDGKARLVFMARVHPRKGMDTIFRLAEELINNSMDFVMIDIYGPIDKVYEDDFYVNLRDHHKIINYNGVLAPDDIIGVLSKYDLMLFPTQFYTEGFPGSILDAYLSRVPVIATEWKYAREIIDDGKSGVVVEFNNEEKFIKEVFNLISNPEYLKKLRLGTEKKAEEYSSETAWNILKINS